ncbi:paternally-expressed gene 3 protein-like [Betta splendens]|uniref:Paternally-expressed gene 3 protein-like n=1 Tax=Betta splendens TaxID=158456 RepID=A0A9W2X9Z4_BETSP|nr:paternally-expressed gene 3 protein-like [Betta splendens]
MEFTCAELPSELRVYFKILAEDYRRAVTPKNQRSAVEVAILTLEDDDSVLERPSVRRLYERLCARSDELSDALRTTPAPVAPPKVSVSFSPPRRTVVSASTCPAPCLFRWEDSLHSCGPPSPVQTRAVQSPAQSCFAQSPAQSCFAQSPAQSCFAQSPAQSCLAQYPAQSCFAQSPAQSCFAQSPAQACFAQSPAQACFAQSPAQSCFAQSPAQSCFAQSPAQSCFAQSPVQSCSAQAPVAVQPRHAHALVQPCHVQVPAPVQSSPVQSSPVQSPVQSSPVQSSPVQSPAQSSPVQSPAQSSPVQSPAQSSPVQSPAQSSPMPVREIRLLGDYSLRSGRSGKSIYPVEELKKVREREIELDDLEELPATYAKAAQLAGKDTRRISGLQDKVMQVIKQSECAEDGSEAEEECDGESATGESERVRRSLADVEYSKLPDPSMVSTPRYLKEGAKPKQPGMKKRVSVAAAFAPGSEVEEEHGKMNGIITLSFQGQPVLSEVVEEASEYPLLAKGANLQYVPWPTMDLEGLVQRLPCLHDGAGKWIAAFEEETIATILAMGDLKAPLGKNPA